LGIAPRSVPPLAEPPGSSRSLTHLHSQLLELGFALATATSLLALASSHAAAGEELKVLTALFLVLLQLLTALGDLSLSAGTDGWCDQALNLWCLHAGLLSLLLDLAAYDKLTDIIILAKAEELADLGGTLGTQSSGVLHISDSLNVLIACLNNNHVQHSDIRANDAATDRLSAALATATTPGLVTDHASSEQ
jgi:hypothetical protein